MGGRVEKEGCFRHLGQRTWALRWISYAEASSNETVRQNVQSTEKIVNQQLKDKEDNLKNNTVFNRNSIMWGEYNTWAWESKPVLF